MKKTIILLALTAQLIFIRDIYAVCDIDDSQMNLTATADGAVPFGCSYYQATSWGKDYKLYNCVWNGGVRNKQSVGMQCCIPPIPSYYHCTLA